MSPTATRSRPATRGPDGARAGIDPRIRARRSAVTRQRGRRRLWVLIGLLLAMALTVGAWYLLHSPMFSARSVTVAGATHETAAEVEAVAGLDSHPPLIDVNAHTVAQRIAQLPWVQSAAVHVQWPDGVHITVTERVPQVVMGTTGGHWAELSGDGRILTVVATRPPGLQLVTGPVTPGVPGTTVAAADRAGILVASTLPPSFRAQVTAVHVEPGGWVQLAMTTPIAVDIGTPTQLPAKYEDVTAILAGATLHTGDVIDVSVPDEPTVTGG
jgi:cell division protein FtsQ